MSHWTCGRYCFPISFLTACRNIAQTSDVELEQALLNQTNNEHHSSVKLNDCRKETSPLFLCFIVGSMLKSFGMQSY